ncbi:MAG: hypothetical protein B6I37_04465 [Desulfobacteraceae bacterium 4572_35.2]|nr:MAG: hypothetical protein B6I37_04465 [Desulfobacteraceae bacterium 4572_35.2]
MISLVPTPDQLPMARGYFDALLLLTFPLHLLFMNAMIGSALITFWSHWRKDPVSERLAYQLAKALPLLIAFTINLGVAPLLFAHNNMTLMLDPEAWKAYFTHSGGAYLNLNEPTLYPRYLHMMIGATAVGGLAVACLSRLWVKKDVEVASLGLNTGMRLFFVATCAQLVAGIWFLLSLPVDIMKIFMGRSPLASAVFIVALVVVIMVLISAWQRKLVVSAGLTIVLVYLMTFMRAFVREGYLAKTYVIQTVESNPDYSPLALFVITLVIGLVLIAWMIKVTLNTDGGAS